MATASTFKISASANDLPFLRNHDRDYFDARELASSQGR
jgi:hypothetical protein